MVMRHVPTCESYIKSLNNAATSQRAVMALFVSCPLVESEAFWNGPIGHKKHLKSAKPTFSSLFVNIAIQVRPYGGCYIAPESVGELSATPDLEHEHAQWCKTLDCLRKPQDRETID